MDGSRKEITRGGYMLSIQLFQKKMQNHLLQV